MPRTAGSGRAPGTPNKINKALKDMILGALDRGGGEDWLLKQMDQQPVAFMSLVGRVLPMQVSGEGGGPVLVITGIKRESDN